jgi:glutamine cyclotransferase
MNASHRLAVLTALVALTAVAGCTDGGAVDTKTEADVNVIVRQYAEDIRAATGGEYTKQGETALACTGKLGETGDDVFGVQGAYQISLSPDRQLPTLAQLREQWKAKGWQITEDETIATNRGKLAATTGENGFTLTLTTAKTPEWLGILIHSPCYRSPTPR